MSTPNIVFIQIKSVNVTRLVETILQSALSNLFVVLKHKSITPFLGLLLEIVVTFFASELNFLFLVCLTKL